MYSVLAVVAEGSGFNPVWDTLFAVAIQGWPSGRFVIFLDGCWPFAWPGT